MKYFILLSVSFLLFSCGTGTNFAKRKYTKGIYIEKHTTAKTKKNKATKKQYSIGNDVQKEVVVLQEGVNENNNPKTYQDNKEESKIANNSSLVYEDYVIEEQQENEVSPPEIYDGETLKKSDPKEPLGLIAFILAFVAVGAYAIATFSNVFIYFFSVSATVALGFTILMYVAVAIAVAAVIMGAISYSRVKTGKAKVAIIIGSIVIGLFLLTLLFAFLVI